MSYNKKVVEMHGCIVCARVFDVLVMYSTQGTLMDYSANSLDAYCLKEGNRVLVVCNSHTGGEIDSAFKRWRSRNIEDLDED